jgi:hypothetical protein
MEKKEEQKEINKQKREQSRENALKEAILLKKQEVINQAISQKIIHKKKKPQ